MSSLSRIDDTVDWMLSSADGTFHFLPIRPLRRACGLTLFSIAHIHSDTTPAAVLPRKKATSAVTRGRGGSGLAWAYSRSQSVA